MGRSILDVEIDHRRDLQRKHLTTVGQLYARAPFVDTILPRLREIIERPWPRLVDLDLALIDWLAAEMPISTPCYRASELDVSGDRNQRLVNLCHHFGATLYISGDAAQHDLHEARFAAASMTSCGTIMLIRPMRRTGNSFPIRRCSISS